MKNTPGPEPSAPGAVDIDPALLLVDQVAAVQRTLPETVAGNLLLGGVVSWTLFGHVPTAGLVLWVALLALHCCVNVWVVAVTRHRPVTLRNAPWRARAGVRSAFVLGLIWAGGILALWPAEAAALPEKFLLVFLVAGVSSGALHSLAAHLPSFSAFFVPTVSAVAAAALREGGAVFQAVAAIAAIYGLVTWRYAASLNRTLLLAMRGRHELAALAARLEQEVRRVEQARRARSRLLAAASHDLRQPVHALSLALGVAAAAPNSPEQAQRLSLAQRSVQGLGAQLDALLDLGQLDAGELRADPRPVRLRPLVESLVEAMRAQAEARGLSLRWRAAEASGLTDPALAERMVRNLIANAIRYTDRGGILVALRVRPDGGARVEVVDTGLGFTPQAQAGLFDEGAQPARRSDRGGFGLGLEIVGGCARLLGHRLSLRSSPGRGSRFTLDIQPLPPGPHARDGAEAAPPQAPTASADGQGPALANRVVVLIEDDPAVRAATIEIVARWGARSVAGADLGEVMAQLTPQALRPALVIADGRLAAGTGGLDAVQQLREEYNDERLPGLVVSADVAALDAARSAGLLALRKPVAPQDLEAAARQALARGAAPSTG